LLTISTKSTSSPGAARLVDGSMLMLMRVSASIVGRAYSGGVAVGATLAVGVGPGSAALGGALGAAAVGLAEGAAVAAVGLAEGAVVASTAASAAWVASGDGLAGGVVAGGWLAWGDGADVGAAVCVSDAALAAGKAVSVAAACALGAALASGDGVASLGRSVAVTVVSGAAVASSGCAPCDTWLHPSCAAITTRLMPRPMRSNSDQR
jgi:hypothetical protein